MNRFTLGAQIGGTEASDSYRAARAQEQQLRNFFNEWRGDYSEDIEEFAFVLRIDANIHTYTEMWQIVGAQPAKLRKGYVAVEIGIPEDWWRLSRTNDYRQLLADEIEKGFRSIIALFQHRHRHIDNAKLLKDWNAIKRRYLRITESELIH